MSSENLRNESIDYHRKILDRSNPWASTVLISNYFERENDTSFGRIDLLRLRSLSSAFRSP